MNNLIKQIVESKFNFNIDIEDNESTLSKSTMNNDTQIGLYEQYKLLIDLGLPSGTKWCKYNLGVDLTNVLSQEWWCDLELLTALDWYGKYYLWGEITDKDENEYTKDYYKYAKNVGYGSIYQLSKYNDKDHLTLLELEDDAAYQLTKYNKFIYKIPTVDLFEELIEYTTLKWVDNYLGIKNLCGKLFIGDNENELFFPACGSISANSQGGSSKGGVKNYGYYWTSQRNDEHLNGNAKAVRLHEVFRTLIEDNSRFNGFSIKPVFYTNE